MPLAKSQARVGRDWENSARLALGKKKEKAGAPRWTPRQKGPDEEPDEELKIQFTVLFLPPLCSKGHPECKIGVVLVTVPISPKFTLPPGRAAWFKRGSKKWLPGWVTTLAGTACRAKRPQRALALALGWAQVVMS